MLIIRGRRCLVVGGGGVALRKVQGLVEEGAEVTVVAPVVVNHLEAMAERQAIRLERRAYVKGEAAGYALVFAATDDPAVNQLVFADAERAGGWANVADDPEAAAFHLPARVRRGPLQIAIGSAGEAPFVVHRLRRLFERRLGDEWGEWLESAARFRAAVRALGLPRPEREARYDRFFDATVDPGALTARVPSAEEEACWLEGCDDAEPDRAPDHRAPLRAAGTTTGLVSLVGAGPGCPGLLTVRALERLRRADVVVYDRLAAAALPCDLPPHVILHPVGKTAGNHPVPQEEINALLVRLAREGRRVVRLKGGDPYVFGRGGEEAEVLVSEGVPYEVVPGVTSGIAAPAWAGIPVTHRRESVRLTLLTAHEAIKGDGPQVRWDLLAQDAHATLVGYMGVTALPQVVERLLAAGMDAATPAALVEQGTTSAQRSVVSTLAGLPAAVCDAGLKPPALFVIGPTVAHAQRLDCVARRPLAGHRIVVPTSADGLALALEDAGADVVHVPLPTSPAARIVMDALPLTGCLVRSPAEVDWLDDERGGAGWSDAAISWCLGPEAAQRARRRGWRRVVELAEGVEGDELVARIADPSN